MRNFEITLILDQSLSDKDVDQICEKYKKYIETEAQGSVPFEERWGRRRLSYEINKKQYGIYHLFFAAMNENSIKELKDTFNLDEKVIKYMILSVKNLENSFNEFKNIKDNPEKTFEIYMQKLQGEI